METDLDINLLHPSGYTQGQPFEQMLWLQEHKPVFWHAEPNGGPGFWALTRYADIKTAEGDWKLFSSQPAKVHWKQAGDFSDDRHRNLLFQDPPAHTEHRKYMANELNPMPVRQMRARVDAIVHEIIDQVIEQGECDLVTDIAGRLASYVTADLLGLPREEAVELYEASEVLNNAPSLSEGEGLAALEKMFRHGQAVFDDRRNEPRADMLTRLAHVEFQGAPVDELHFKLDFLLLVTAGGDTSRNVVAGGTSALFDNPDQRALLGDGSDETIVVSAVEEMLRWVTPIVYQRRVATADTVINGQQIKEGERLFSFYGAGNRDPRVFKDPMSFNVRRTPDAHLAFGFGRHFCLGSHLARLELLAMFTAMLKRMPDLEPTRPTEWLHSGAQVAPTVVGPRSMPVRFTPGPRLH
jgi:cytochrome P450